MKRARFPCRCPAYISLYYQGRMTLPLLKAHIADCLEAECIGLESGYGLSHTINFPHGVEDIDPLGEFDYSDMHLVRPWYNRREYYYFRNHELQTET